jgi:hypothetical protein
MMRTWNHKTLIDLVSEGDTVVGAQGTPYTVVENYCYAVLLCHEATDEEFQVRRDTFNRAYLPTGKTARRLGPAREE